MSTFTREIQVTANLDEKASAILRAFALEWRNGAIFIAMALRDKGVSSIASIALADALTTYSHMVKEGVDEYERLKFVLGHLYQVAKGRGLSPTREQTEQWCQTSRLPTEISEYLIHG